MIVAGAATSHTLGLGYPPGSAMTKRSDQIKRRKRLERARRRIERYGYEDAHWLLWSFVDPMGHAAALDHLPQ